MTNKALVFSLFIGLLLAFSCSEPLKERSFANVEGLDGWKLNDTLKLSIDLRQPAHSTVFFLQAQTTEPAFRETVSEFVVFITFESPSGRSYRDTAILNLQQGSIIEKNGEYQIQWPYIESTQFNMEGLWHIYIRRAPEDNPIYNTIQGMGIAITTDINS